MSQGLERDRRHRGRRDQGSHQGAGIARRLETRILPLPRDGADARFGLIFPRISPASRARTARAYLVGLRAPGESARHWLRVVVTDLTLSAIEEPGRVRFAVTSLATAQPIAGAQLRVEGVRDDKFVTLAQGTTDASGFFTWSLAKRAEANYAASSSPRGLIRWWSIRVARRRNTRTKIGRSLTPTGSPGHEPRAAAHREAAHAMPSFHGKADLSSRGGRAYQGLRAGVSRRRVEPAEARRDAGRQRSGNQEWRIPVKPDASALYHKFDALTPATGIMRSNTNPPG